MTAEELQIQNAFGIGLAKRVFPDSDGMRHWMDDGDIVEFTNPEFTSQNAVFRINNDKNWIIWYSQLQGYFFSPILDGYSQGDITFKNGTKKAFNSMYRDEFWRAVRGKKFRVEIEPDFVSTVDEKNYKVQEMQTYDIIIDYILDKISKKNWTALNGILKGAREYSLIEV